MPLKNTLVKVVFFFIVLILGGFGCALLGISCLPFEEVKCSIDGLAPDGKSEQFDVVLFEQIATRARFIGIILIMFSGDLCYCRNHVWKYLLDLFHASAHCFKGLTKQLRDAVRTEEKMHLYALFIILYFLIHGLIDTPFFKNDLLILLIIFLEMGIISNPKPSLEERQ